MLGSQWRLGTDQFSLIPRRPLRVLSKLYIWIFYGHPPLKRRSTIMLRPPWDGEFTAAFGPFRPVPRQSLLTVGRSLTHSRHPRALKSLTFILPRASLGQLRALSVRTICLM
jgi:hypothetical protein